MSSFQKLALAQINVTVGDIAGNIQKIFDGWKLAENQGAQLVAFPELCVVGYPAEDLILSPDFRKQAMQAVQELAKKTANGPGIILGCVWENCEDIYNAALLLDGGNITHIQPKTRLPNYGVFDEKRLFVSGAGPKVATFRGHNIGILVCEDVWDESLSVELKKQGAETIIVINASPYEIGKAAHRIEIIERAAKASGLAISYVNLVGGQDDIVFDGGSFFMSATGKIEASFPQFEEVISAAASHHVLLSQEAEIWSAMVTGLRDYVHKNGFVSVLLGLSGGIDSAVSAAVAVDALGADNVLGVLLPSPFTSQESIDDANHSAILLGIQTRTIRITQGMELFDTLLTPEFVQEEWMTEPAIGGNLQARLRGITLMALSNKFGYLLLSTGNKSELAVGYSTLYGDACGSFNVLKDVYKTRVYALAHWRNGASAVIPPRSISKAPSAELKPDQKDADQLPPYDVLDAILEHHIEGRLQAADIIAKGFEKSVVEKTLRLVRLNEYKRRQSCPGVKITGMMFGRDRRFPLTNKF